MKCDKPELNIIPRSFSFVNPIISKRNDMIVLKGITIIKCSTTLSNEKQWLIYKLNDLNGNVESRILLKNLAVNYADLVIQPKSLEYGVYKIVYKVIMSNTSFYEQVDTFLKIEPTGLVLSSLRLMRPMYGGLIEITRGLNQTISFDPYLFTQDLDQVVVISSFKFKYSCQIIESNVVKGGSGGSGYAQIYLSDLKLNSSLKSYEECLNNLGF